MAAEQTDPCIVCELADQPTGPGETPTAYRTHCKRCGVYDWERDAPQRGRAARQIKMSGFIHDQNRAGIIPRFTAELVARVEQMPSPSLKERADRLLLVLVGQENITSWFDPTPEVALWAVSYSADAVELELLLEILELDGLLQGEGGVWRITPRGFLYAEDFSRNVQDSHQGFVAMSFDSSMNESYTNGFDAAIRAAGYSPMRIDRKEHINGISDEILAEIRRSRFVVADYTLANNGVYFEVGFAVGLNVQVIPTCRVDFSKTLHFDVRHINTLIWKDPDDLRESLARRISAVIGDGPLGRLN